MKTGKNLKYSITDFQNDNFRLTGEIIAVSITQDGPPPNFFLECNYNFISSGEIKNDQLSKAIVTDPDLLDLIDKCNCPTFLCPNSPNAAADVQRIVTLLIEPVKEGTSIDCPLKVKGFSIDIRSLF